MDNQNTNSRYKVYRNKEEYEEAFFQRMYDREGTTLHVDSKGILTLPGGVATSFKRDDGTMRHMNKKQIDEKLEQIGGRKLTEEEYAKVQQSQEYAGKALAKEYERDNKKNNGTLTPNEEDRLNKESENAVEAAKKAVGYNNGKDENVFGISHSDDGLRKLIKQEHESRKKDVDDFVRKNLPDMPENAAARVELESMVYNGGKNTLGPGLTKAAQKAYQTGDFSDMENEIRNRTNPSADGGLNNRRGKEANGFRDSIKEEYRGPEVPPKIKYSNESIENGAIVDEPNRKHFEQYNQDKGLSIYDNLPSKNGSSAPAAPQKSLDEIFNQGEQGSGKGNMPNTDAAPSDSSSFFDGAGETLGSAGSALMAGGKMAFNTAMSLTTQTLGNAVQHAMATGGAGGGKEVLRQAAAATLGQMLGQFQMAAQRQAQQPGEPYNGGFAGGLSGGLRRYVEVPNSTQAAIETTMADTHNAAALERASDRVFTELSTKPEGLKNPMDMLVNAVLGELKGGNIRVQPQIFVPALPHQQRRKKDESLGGIFSPNSGRVNTKTEADTGQVMVGGVEIPVRLVGHGGIRTAK